MWNTIRTALAAFWRWLTGQPKPNAGGGPGEEGRPK